ncbi:MAG: replication-relaxation family protein [Proteobacteria bacterium]|nr:replication-relaxation family protein [Pseudomonadota bacterium]
MIARRSRQRRIRTGKSIEITTRDIAIFKWLSRYRYLPSTYLHAFCGGLSEKRFIERLGDLFHEGFIDRPSVQWETAGSRHKPAIHELGAGARRILAEQDDLPMKRTWLGTGPQRQFRHALMICEIVASIELAVTGHTERRFVTWPEILAKAPSATRAAARPFAIAAEPDGLVPDALFGLEYAREGKSAYRFFALEADRMTMPLERQNKMQTSLAAKLAMYDSVIGKQTYRGRWGIPNLLVLVVTAPQRVEALIRRQPALSAHANFLFKAAPSTLQMRPDTSLYETPWKRLTPEPLDLTG